MIFVSFLSWSVPPHFNLWCHRMFSKLAGQFLGVNKEPSWFSWRFFECKAADQASSQTSNIVDVPVCSMQRNIWKSVQNINMDLVVCWLSSNRYVTRNVKYDLIHFPQKRTCDLITAGVVKCSSCWRFTTARSVDQSFKLRTSNQTRQLLLCKVFGLNDSWGGNSSHLRMHYFHL